MFCGLAMAPKNQAPSCVVRSSRWKAATSGRCQGACLVTCSMRRLTSSSCTPRTLPGASTAACSPAMPAGREGCVESGTHTAGLKNTAKPPPTAHGVADDERGLAHKGVQEVQTLPRPGLKTVQLVHALVPARCMLPW